VQYSTHYTYLPVRVRVRTRTGRYVYDVRVRESYCVKARAPACFVYLLEYKFELNGTCSADIWKDSLS